MSAPPAVPPLRPLPPRPSLEFERKEAKALLRRLRAGDPDALARVRAWHPRLDVAAPERVRLADAQLVIAREYGFASWPRLVRWFGDVERQLRSPWRPIRSERRDFFDASVRSLLAEHRQRRAWAGRALAAYVPRFYGARLEDVFAAAVGEDDARLAVARLNGSPSWETLLARAATERRCRPGDWEAGPIWRAGRAIEAADLDALRRVVEAHPELLHPSEDDLAVGRSLLRVALHHERKQGPEKLRPIVDWLAAQEFDVQGELNRQLCGRMGMTPEEVRWLLDRGADPDWVAPTGIPVLEHALLRYWNGAAVDVLAARATPRRALWIAAGLGDVGGVRRFLDGAGRPTPAARRLRPEFDAVGGPPHPSLPEPGDEDILMEAFLVAMLNGRVAVLEHMVARGFPLDSLAWDSPPISLAIGNAWVSVVECLVRLGADLDLRGWRPHQSAREMARELFEQDPGNAGRRRIIELCGLDPDAALAEHDARHPSPPPLEPALREALDLATDDARRLGQPDVRPGNLLFGLLRAGGLPLLFFTKASRMDLERFRDDVRERIRPAADRAGDAELPLHPDARGAVDEALALAAGRRREAATGLHLLYALVRDGRGPAAELLARHGSRAEQLTAELERAM